MKNEKKKTADEVFGSLVFNDAVMKKRLPKEAYRALRKTVEKGESLTLETANVIAEAMKQWAVELGATHFTHWFQPLTGFTAEKQEAFIVPEADGTALLKFSGKELIKGEPDASSFPSGGLRATFEARGYTAWDTSSPAFIKDEGGGRTLCIPTAFCSYTGEALDKKTPLLRSMEALSKQAVRVLRLLGNKNVTHVVSTLGAEQEYFLIDRDLYEQRPDLIYTGRTLFGAMAPKGQELEDHYFGAIKERISAFMNELDSELWKLGVSSRTRHNEVAPAQHELAPLFSTANIAADHNQLTMEILKKVALRHDLVCLLHEKPFAGVNGSGKHNNWSMATDDGQNLLDPGHTPHDNAQFLLFLAALLKAVDENAELLRVSAANPGNDHRLGANEAPPAIISVYLGDQLADVIDQIDKGDAKSSKKGGFLEIGSSVLPPLPLDTSDRNRTSPFAFTGNKFEFRMVPSSASVSGPVWTLNTIVADVLREFADRLEKASSVDAEIKVIVKEVVHKHKRVIFNGNGYTDEWVAEAARRGLPNIKNTVDATQAIVSAKTKALFKRTGVLSEGELDSRCEIMLENYIKTIRIEALTMVDMSERLILPAGMKYAGVLASSINAVAATGTGADTSVTGDRLKQVSSLLKDLSAATGALRSAIEKAEAAHGHDTYETAKVWRDAVFAGMVPVRAAADKLEVIVDTAFWPLPTYGDLLFKV